MIPRDAYTGTSILIVGFIIINYISVEFIFEEKRLNEISENKFSSKIIRYMVSVSDPAIPFYIYVRSYCTYSTKLFAWLTLTS